MNVKSLATNSKLELNKWNVNVELVSKYLGIFGNCKFSSTSHILFAKTRLGKKSGIVSIIRYYVPRIQLLQ